MKKARTKFQEEYEKKAKIALEKQKEVHITMISFGFILVIIKIVLLERKENIRRKTRIIKTRNYWTINK